MQMKITWILNGALAAVLALGCGGGDDDQASVDGPPASDAAAQIDAEPPIDSPPTTGPATVTVQNDDACS